jgi:hypothetical protein
MSAVMLLSRRLGIMGAHPPERIVERGMRAAGHRPTREEVDAAATVTHLGFGAACGVAYGLVAHRLPAAVAALLGIPFALLVWAVSYAGWIPALRILPPPPDDQPGRVGTMLTAHVVYGAVLGAAWRALARR